MQNIVTIKRTDQKFIAMSIEHLKSLGIFAEVAQQGSFRGAARALGMTPAAVTYHVQLLEQAVGGPLIYRSTRKLTLTETGERLRDAASNMRHLAEAGLEEALNGDGTLRGRFRIALTVSLLRSPVSNALAQFQRDHPNVDLDLCYSDTAHDLIADQIDLALRAGVLQDSSLKCTHVWEMPRILVATPRFLAEHGKIETLDDLAQVPWIKHSHLGTRRRLTHISGTSQDIEQDGNLSVDNIEAMVDLATHGMAVASPPRHYVATQIADGSLVEILPDWSLPAIPVHAIWPGSKVEKPTTKAFLAMLSHHTKAQK